MKKINFKQLFISLIIPFLVAAVVSFATKDYVGIYSTLNKPFFAPPRVVFPIVWSILYLLMGISLYIVMSERFTDKAPAYTAFALQLVVNASWSIFFFNFRFYLVSFIITVLMAILIFDMIKKFAKISKTSAYLQTPYFLWTIFAGVLNLFIYIMN